MGVNRVINPSKYLKGIVDDGKTFYIGMGVQSLTEIGKNHPNLSQLIKGEMSSVLIKGKGGVLKENTFGKFVRKKPERKERIWKHIHYYSKRFEKEIDYNREYYVWEKELLHKYNMVLERASTPQGEIILHFPAFIMDDNYNLYLKVGAAMNMAIVLGSYYMIYDNMFEPIIPVTKVEDRKILSSGNLTLAQKLDFLDKNYVEHDGEIDLKGNSYRFAMLKEKRPSDVTIGLGGFNEYVIFEYANDNLLIFENLKSGNAPFLFKRDGFNNDVAQLNKQNAKSNPYFLKRIVHDKMESWHNKLSKFFIN